MSYGQLNICIYRSIDIVSRWEIPAIARRAFISIENERPPNAIAHKACISIEQFVQPKLVARRAITIKRQNEKHPEN